MDPITLSRWQFGLTTVYHFLFVPLPLELGWFVAYMQTRYYQTRDESWRKMAKFWGKLFLINFAIGVVPGIVQEFQFGMKLGVHQRFPAHRADTGRVLHSDVPARDGLEPQPGVVPDDL